MPAARAVFEERRSYEQERLRLQRKLEDQAAQRRREEARANLRFGWRLAVGAFAAMVPLSLLVGFWMSDSLLSPGHAGRLWYSVAFTSFVLLVTAGLPLAVYEAR